jgi:WD40 repeat protein
MAHEVERRAHAILKQLIELEEADRAIEAERLCGGDAATLTRVRALLAALERTDAFLERPVGAAFREAAAARSERHVLPAVPGFTIERLVGVGGMAAVYEATQELPRRRVALKILRRSVAGPDALRRFEFETEVLAKLRHPAIAAIFEAGTFDDGAGLIPYFAMELVEGARTITAHCVAERLALAARIELMIRVCDAVQHGHLNGVIHRDLKPANVLVDANGQPRVIDFGIARAAREGGRDQATTAGQMIGTLNAMSPEQCTPRATVDARTDVYSLGVLLYEVLCGAPPHDLDALPVHEAIHTIQRVEPRRPSAIDPRLRGDVEAIVLKAMAKEPERRYGSVAALAADLRRLLAHQAIEARAPTMLYQARLFARRNRTLVTAAGLGFVALVAATAISLRSAFVAADELRQRTLAEARADRERDKALRKSYLASISAAVASFQYGEMGQVRRHVRDAPVEHRGWEWGFLASTSDGSARTVVAHDRAIRHWSVDRDGATAVTLDEGGSVRRWRLADGPDVGTMLSEWRPDAGSATAVLLDRHGRTLVGSGDGTLLRLDGVGAESEVVARVSDEEIVGLSEDRQGRIAIVTDEGHLFVLPPGADRPEAVTLGGRTVRRAKFADDGSLLVVWDAEESIVVLDGATLTEHRSWKLPGDIGCVEVRADIDRIAVGRANGIVSIVSIASGKEITTLQMRDGLSLVRSIAFDATGSRIAIGQGNSAITLVGLPDAELLYSGTGHEEAIAGISFVDGGARLATASWDGTIRWWEPRQTAGMAGLVLSAHEGGTNCVAFSPIADRFVTGGADRAIRLWSIGSYDEIATLEGHTGTVLDVCYAPDGQRLASASSDGTVRVWLAHADGEPFRLERVLTGHERGVWAVDISPDGTLLASCGDDATVRLWDLATGLERAVLRGHLARVTDVLFSPDGSRLASSSREGSARVWSVASGEQVARMSGHAWDVFAVAWSDDGERLFTASRDQTVRIWNARDGSGDEVIDGVGQFVTSLAWSPDRSRLAAAGWFGSVSLIDPSTREIVMTYRAAGGTIRRLAFSPDGRYLAVPSSDGRVQLLDGGAPGR